MNSGDFDNYWVQPPKAEPTLTTPALQIDTIDGVEPLDAQLGIADLKTVPDALYGPLFGQPDDTPLHTYVILDAAKVPNLPELLEVSGLAHRCLFKGDAYDELKDVAPWIVQLEDGNAFTRNLFTQTDAQWHLWDQEPGIYLRSSNSLAEMCRHFRKFTKVQDEQGKWFYCRFWEPSLALSLALTDADRAAAFFSGVSASVHLLPSARAALVLRPEIPTPVSQPLRWTQKDLQAVGIVHASFAEIQDDPPPGPDLWRYLMDCCSLCEGLPHLQADLVRAICGAVRRDGTKKTRDRLVALSPLASRVSQKRAIDSLTGGGRKPRDV